MYWQTGEWWWCAVGGDAAGSQSSSSVDIDAHPVRRGGAIPKDSG